MKNGRGYSWIREISRYKDASKPIQRFTMNGGLSIRVFIYSYCNTLRGLGDVAFSYNKMNLSSMDIGCGMGCKGFVDVNLIQALLDTYLFIALSYFPPKWSINIQENKDKCGAETCKETKIPYCILCESIISYPSQGKVFLSRAFCVQVPNLRAHEREVWNPFQTFTTIRYLMRDGHFGQSLLEIQMDGESTLMSAYKMYWQPHILDFLPRPIYLH